MNKEMNRVLVVDDDSRIVRFVRISLEARGYDVIIAADGQEALQMVEVESPDIMLLDIIMPGMDGFEVMRRLRKCSSLPVIAWSADSSKGNEILRLGATFFIPKPVDPDYLATKIGEILSGPAVRG